MAYKLIQCQGKVRFTCGIVRWINGLTCEMVIVGENVVEGDIVS